MFKKIFVAFIPPAIVFVFHIFLVSLGVYLVADWMDIPMHFLGGAAMAYTFSSLLLIAKNKNLLGKNHKLINFLFVICLVALIAIFWEFFEYILAITTNFRWQNTLQDTLFDLFMGLVGSPIGFALSKKIA